MHFDWKLVRSIWAALKLWRKSCKYISMRTLFGLGFVSVWMWKGLSLNWNCFSFKLSEDYLETALPSARVHPFLLNSIRFIAVADFNSHKVLMLFWTVNTNEGSKIRNPNQSWTNFLIEFWLIWISFFLLPQMNFASNRSHSLHSELCSLSSVVNLWQLTIASYWASVLRGQ